jgi:hypothetical protein
MMESYLAQLKASYAFFSTVLSPVSRPSAISDQGYELHAGWTQSPETLRLRFINTKDKPFALLFGIRGLHSGEVYALSRDIQSLGSSYGCTHSLDRNEAVHIHKNRRFESKVSFKQNGKECYQTRAQDYDVFDFGKAEFLYLEIDP